MIPFRDITTADRDVIESFTLPGDRQNCDLTFANIIGWRFLYNTQYAIVSDCLVMRFFAGHHLAYMTPVPRPSVTDDDAGLCPPDVIEALREDARIMGSPFLLLGADSRLCGIMERFFPDTFDFRIDRDYSDYIYLRERLASLSGKRLQAKRNHANRFRAAYPDYEYKPLTPGLFPACLALERQWREAETGAAAVAERSSLDAELRSMTRMFHRWDALSLTGGTLWVDGRMVAFTYGAPVNHNTFDVCMEKADVAFEGSYAAINREFAMRLPEQYVYINREEDLGIEGLRQSKLSYKPELILEKYAVVERRPLSGGEPAERIKEETRRLWNEVFGDSEAFVELYFSRVFRSSFNVACSIGGKVSAALQRLPFTLLFRGEEVPAAYVSGVCVAPDMCRRHIGTALMRRSNMEMYQHGTVFAALIPAEEWLFDWYATLGYRRVTECVPPPHGVAEMTFDAFNRWQRSHDCILLHSREWFAVVQDDIALSGEAWEPPAGPVGGMIRIINVLEALRLWARLHPHAERHLLVYGDSDIAANNAYYDIMYGRAIQTDVPHPDAQKLSVGDLALFIFSDDKAIMTLMLN
ncbi:MAG: GNAT family N-acetyltransferase [Prevotella sp.]